MLERFAGPSTAFAVLTGTGPEHRLNDGNGPHGAGLLLWTRHAYGGQIWSINSFAGAGAVYLVPGESFLPVLDALFDASAVRTIVCRHEGGASMMAEAAGRLTGRRASPS